MKRAGGQNSFLGITLEIINLNHYNVSSGDINARILINLSHRTPIYGLYSPKNVITGGRDRANKWAGQDRPIKKICPITGMSTQA